MQLQSLHANAARRSYSSSGLLPQQDAVDDQYKFMIFVVLAIVTLGRARMHRVTMVIAMCQYLSRIGACEGTLCGRGERQRLDIGRDNKKKLKLETRNAKIHGTSRWASIGSRLREEHAALDRLQRMR